MLWSGHCLHTLLPDLKVIDIVLRNSGTSFNLHHCSYKLYKQSFVNRCLFRDCYWHVLLCGTLYAIWSDLICYHFSPHNWMAFVRPNKRYVMLCYINIVRQLQTRDIDIDILSVCPTLCLSVALWCIETVAHMLTKFFTSWKACHSSFFVQISVTVFPDNNFKRCAKCRWGGEKVAFNRPILDKFISETVRDKPTIIMDH